MTSETDSSKSSSSSSFLKKRKTNKKLKKKSDKKHKKQKKEKKHKHKKRIQQDEIRYPELKNMLPSKMTVVETDAFGPALPPNLQLRRDLVADDYTQVKLIGPVMPSDLKNTNETMRTDAISELDDKPILIEDIGEDIDMHGPIPVASTAGTYMNATHIELEKRALELKLAAIEGINTQTVEQKVREEWMLELPEVGLKGGLAALSNMKRTFHQGKERPDFSDRSVWTKTPLSEESSSKASSSKTTAETLKKNAQANYERKRDEEQESIAKKHKKKHKREESLVDMHQKKLRKEQKRKLKELEAAGAKPERRPFSRDVDLKLNKIDKDRTKQIVGKAKILDSKFSSGNTKYL